MARINIEDDIESRQEFWNLLPFSGGDRDTAMGKLVRFFRLSQKHYGRGETIPRENLETQGLGCMIDSGWAIECMPNEFQALGADKQFAWYFEKSSNASAAGKASAESRKKKYGTAQPSNERRTNVEQARTASNPLTLSPSLTPTNKDLPSVDTAAPRREEKTALEETVPLKAKDGAKTRAFVAAYSESYRARYKTRPPCLDDGKTIGEITRFLKHRPLEASVQLMQAYLQMEDDWFKTKCHDFTTFSQSINRIGVALANGRADPHKKSFDELVNEMEAKERERAARRIQSPN